MRIAAKVTVPAREFLGFCENVADYADAVDGKTEVVGFTSGEFSIIDVVKAIVARMDAPRLVFSTWTAAGADMKHVHEMIERGGISAARWIVDRLFQNRQPELCGVLRARFGDDAIRAQRVHCKFVMLEDDERKILVQTSANLNKNMRIENVQVSPCPVLFGAYAGLVEDIFGTQVPGAGFEESRHVTASFREVVGRKSRKKTISAPWHATP